VHEPQYAGKQALQVFASTLNPDLHAVHLPVLSQTEHPKANYY